MNTPANKSPDQPQSSELNNAPEAQKTASNQTISSPQSSSLNSTPKTPVSVTPPPVITTERHHKGSELNTAPQLAKTAQNLPASGSHSAEFNSTPKPTTGADTKIEAGAKSSIKPETSPSLNAAPTTPANTAQVPKITKVDSSKIAEVSKFIAQNPRPIPPTVETPKDVPVVEKIKTDIYTPEMTIAERKEASRNRLHDANIKINPTKSDNKHDKTPKGFYLRKLLTFEFDQLGEVEARKAYNYMREMTVKSQLQRNVPIKVLFTKGEADVIEKIARDLKIEKAKAVRRLCFTGPSNEEALAEFMRIKNTMATMSSNLNQLLQYLNSKTQSISDKKTADALIILQEIKALQMVLDKRLAR